MGEDRFTLTYDGEALKQGLMDVRELAPALLSAGELIHTANRLINGDRTRVSLQVRSDFRSGSFNIDLLLVQDLIDQAKQFLSIHPQIKDARELLETLFFWGGLPVGAGAGLFKFIKWLRGRSIASGHITFNDGLVQIQLGDNSIQIPESVFRLAQDETIRKYAEGMVQPLKREGIQELRLNGGDDRQESVDESEAAYFEAGFRDGITLLENDREAILEIVRLSFNPEHKWGFTDGTSRIRANITDNRFWTEVRAGLRFAKGDHVMVRLKTRTFRNDADELKSEYTVEEVIKHIPRRPSTQLPF